MSDQFYKKMITQRLISSNAKMIQRTPQPTMFSQEPDRLVGGKIARRYVQTNMNLEPSTLTVTGLHTKTSLRDSMLDEDVLDNPEPSKILPALAKPKRTRKLSRKKQLIEGGDIWDDGYNLAKQGYNTAKDTAIKYAPQLIEQGVKKYGPMVAEKALEYLPYAIGLGRSSKKGSKTARGQLVAKLMKEKGLTLGQASKYIKEHQLM